MRLFKLGIAVASVNYREAAVLGHHKARHFDFSGEFCLEAFAEWSAVGIEREAEWAAKDDAIRFNRGRHRDEAEQHAAGNIEPIFGVGDFVDHLAILGIDGAGGGEIFPFFFDAFVGKENVAGFEIAVAFGELAIFDNAATDAGREGEVKGAAFAMMRFGERGKVGVIFDENREAEILFKLFGDIKIVPIEIAEPNGDIALNDARHGDGAGFDARYAKIDANLLAEVFVKLALVLDGGKFDRVQNFARGVDEGNKSFRTSNINT